MLPIDLGVHLFHTHKMPQPSSSGDTNSQRNTTEFDLVDGHLHVSRSLTYEPQAHVGVTGVKSNGRGDRYECRCDAAGKSGLDSKFLAALPTGRCSRMLIRLDVATRREEQARVQVVNQQDIEVVALEDYDIRHEMTVRSSRL